MRVTDLHPRCELRHTGALAGPSVHIDDAFEANAHATENAARRAVPGPPKAENAGRGQGGGQGLAFEAGQRSTVEGERDGLSDGTDGGIGEAAPGGLAGFHERL